MVIGSRLGEDSLGAVDRLTAEHRAKLTEPGTIVVDESDMGRLGVTGLGDVAEVSGVRVKVVRTPRAAATAPGRHAPATCRRHRGPEYPVSLSLAQVRSSWPWLSPQLSAISQPLTGRCLGCSKREADG